MTKKPSPKNAASSNDRVICQNRKATFNFTVLDTLECGVVLHGSEVKSLRNGKISLDEAYARVKGSEVWLLACDIPEYAEASHFNHAPKRPRKLLLHRREIKRFAALALQKGLTLVPLRLYFKDGLAKILLGLCKGKQVHDKREAMKKADSDRALRQQMAKRW